VEENSSPQSLTRISRKSGFNKKVIPLKYEKPPFNFLGVEGQTFAKAAVVVLPVPYNGTNKWTTWGARSDKGPKAIIDASRNLELFDEELETEVSRKGVFTLPPIRPAKKPEQVVGQVCAGVEKILAAKKFPLVLGGEHSITPGAVRAAKKSFPDLTVLQFDAHADLRNEFDGTKWSHACAARRVIDEKAKLVQVGVRSVCEEDWWFIEKARVPVFFAKDEDNWTPEDIVAKCGPNVFVTFDLDALDPSIMPSTSTPEPGGLSWKRSLSILRAVARARRIVGADVVELSPIKGLAAPDFLAAKLAYKVLGYALAAKK